MSKKYENNEENADSLTISKVALWQIIAAVLAVVLIASIFTSGFGFKAIANTNVVKTAPTVNQLTGNTPTAAGSAKISLEGAHTLGDPEAKVMMVEYSSFTCPYCKRFHDQTFDQIKENYIDAGKIYYVYKPFTRNQVDVVAANAAECAGEQGKFFEYAKLIYTNQASLSDQNAFLKFASDLDLDEDEFKECFDAQKYSQKASQNLQEGQANGVTGTPGFLIDGNLIPGAQPYNVFASAIDAALG